jgi:tripartite-type tricarboxylate transporter receptor subunit TctC
MKRRMLGALLACIGHLLVLQGAQAFPDRPVRIVVPTPPGGPPDIMARLLTEKMGAALGQPVIVENRTGGAAGMIGAKAVLGAEPDGYTLLMGSTSTLMIAPLIYKNANYDAKSFAPVAGLSESAELLTVNPAVAAKTVAELVRLANSEPGELHYGSAGVGSLPHLEGELFKARAHIDMVHVPYRGGGPALLWAFGRRGSDFLLNRDADAAVCPRRPLARACRYQRHAQCARARHSDDAGKRLRSIRHRIDQFPGRAARHADRDQAPAQRCGGARARQP